MRGAMFAEPFSGDIEYYGHSGKAKGFRSGRAHISTVCCFRYGIGRFAGLAIRNPWRATSAKHTHTCVKCARNQFTNIRPAAPRLRVCGTLDARKQEPSKQAKVLVLGQVAFWEVGAASPPTNKLNQTLLPIGTGHDGTRRLG